MYSIIRNILLLTDFSENAAHAAKAALNLATQLHTGVILHHSTQSIRYNSISQLIHPDSREFNPPRMIWSALLLK